MEKAEVLIVGAGPVGLSLALGLSRQGVRSILIEAKETPDPHSRAGGIHARTREIFQNWGVLDRFLEEGKLLEHAEIWEAGKEKPAAAVDFSRMKRFTRHPGALFLEQPRTEAILRERVEELGLCQIRMGNRLDDYEAGADGVEARIVPVGGEPYSVEADFLVGCDGGKSRVRQGMGVKLEGKTYQTKAVLADVHFPDGRADLPWPRYAAREKGVLAALRLSKEIWRIISLDDGFPTDATGQRVQALFGAGPFETIWSSEFQLHCRKAPRFHKGRVVIAGDAAHLNSPVGGQGMNSGIQDANALAWRLAYAVRGGDTEKLLASYESERRQAISTRVNRMTDILTKIFLINPRARRFAFGAAMKLLKQPTFLDFFLPKFGMLNSSRRPKDLRLIELAGDRGGLFFYGAPPKGDFSDLPVPVQTLAGGARKGKVVLVRPDGAVGWSAFAPGDEEIRRSVSRALGLAHTGGRLHALFRQNMASPASA